MQEHFDVETVTGYFLSGKLMEWLEDRYYEDEAEKLRSLDKDAPDFQQKLCEALGVEYDAEDDLDVAALEWLNEKKAILRQRTDDEKIIRNADKTALTQEDLADLLDMGEDVIYLCGEEFTVPARIKNKKYIGILGTPKVMINAKSEDELTDKGILFENVVLPWGNTDKIEEAKQTIENAPIMSYSDWPVPFEKLHKLIMASFAKEVAFKTEDKDKSRPRAVAVARMRRKIYYNTDKDKVWTVDGETQGIELDDTQKEIELSVVCGGAYDIGDIVYIRVAEDLSAGWAFTKDSFCASNEDETIIIPYKFLKIAKVKENYEDEDGSNYKGALVYCLKNANSNDEWLFYSEDDDYGFVKSGLEPIHQLDTAKVIEKCLNTMKNLFKKE